MIMAKHCIVTIVMIMAMNITYVGLHPSVKLRGGLKALVALPAFSSNSWPWCSDEDDDNHDR